MDLSIRVWLIHPEAFSAPECCPLYCCRFPDLVLCTDHGVHGHGLPLLHGKIWIGSVTQMLPIYIHQTASNVETQQTQIQRDIETDPIQSQRVSQDPKQIGIIGYIRRFDSIEM